MEGIIAELHQYGIAGVFIIYLIVQSVQDKKEASNQARILKASLDDFGKTLNDLENIILRLMEKKN